MTAGAAERVAASSATHERRFVPDAYERILAVAAVVLGATVVVALIRGRAEWGLIGWPVWAHLVTVMAALALTPVMLLRPRGDRRHRLLGRVWVTAMLLTAALSFDVRQSHPGHFSVIHLLSAYVIVAAPMIWWTARTHRVKAHRRQVRGMVTGALIIAGFFTLPFGRLLGHWLFA